MAKADTGLTKSSPLDMIRGGDVNAMRDLSFEELAKLAEALPDDEKLYATQTGDGVRLVRSADKKHLIGVPFIILDWTMYPSAQRPGTYFTTVLLKTQHPVNQLGGGQDFRLNDGGTGIHSQLQALRDQGFKGVLICEKGLRVSEDYVVVEPAWDDEGNPVIDEVTKKQVMQPKVDPVTKQEIHGTTYFLDNTL